MAMPLDKRADESRERRRYQRPEIISYGKVSDLAMGNGTNTSEYPRGYKYFVA